MEETGLYLLLLSLLSLLFIRIFYSNIFLKKHKKNLPPSPPGYPIIGHLHLARKGPPHRILLNLSLKYGPIFSLQMGSRSVLVISSPAGVEECFTTNDIILANRPQFLVGKYLHYNNTTFGASNYGPHWRNLRKVATTAMLSNAKLDAYLDIRHDEVKSLVKILSQEPTQSFTKVDMRSLFSGLSINIVMREIAGKRYFGCDVENIEEAKKFKEILEIIFELGATENIEDLFPIFQWIDLQRIHKRMRNAREFIDEFFQGLIDEHKNKIDGISLQHNYKGKKSDTLIETMLSLQQSEPDYYTNDIIKGMILVLLTTGSETTSANLEWFMSLLLNNPTAFAKARAEIDEYVGQERLIEESDLPKLQFLDCIAKETQRLHPVGSLLVPHQSSEDCVIGGYNVAAGTIILVNAWAIHRDPEFWEDSTTFKPERFEGKGGDEFGYNYIPFGVGRRKCPGYAFATRIVALTIGSLIQCFDWERVNEELVDLSEGKEQTLRKKTPLEAMCRPRRQTIHLLSQL